VTKYQDTDEQNSCKIICGCWPQIQLPIFALRNQSVRYK